MCEAKVILHKTAKKSYFECNTCGKAFEGYDCYTKSGQNRYCSRRCTSIAPRIVKENSFYHLQKLKKLARYAAIVEYHVSNPNATLGQISDALLTHETTVSNALDCYYQRGGEFVLIIQSDIDSEKAIKLSDKIVLL